MGDWSNKLVITFSHISPRKAQITYFEITFRQEKNLSMFMERRTMFPIK